jgi:hypothetical protein
MTDEEIFDIAEQYGWMDDFGRWNFKETGLIKFALALLEKREWVGLTEDEKQFFKAMGFSGIDIVEAKLKEKNS